MIADADGTASEVTVGQSIRVYIIAVGFLAWGGLVIMNLYQIMVVDRDRYIREFESRLWRVGTVPAMRGRILDRNGQPLAWSVRYFALAYIVPESKFETWNELTELAQRLGVNSIDMRTATPGDHVMIKSELTPEEIIGLQPLLDSHARLKIVSRFRRVLKTGNSDLTRMIGNTRLDGVREIGVSGLEKLHDLRLTGTDGKYRVMVDSRNQWVPDTWEELHPPLPGYDVYTAVTMD